MFGLVVHISTLYASRTHAAYCGLSYAVHSRLAVHTLSKREGLRCVLNLHATKINPFISSFPRLPPLPFHRMPNSMRWKPPPKKTSLNDAVIAEEGFTFEGDESLFGAQCFVSEAVG